MHLSHVAMSAAITLSVASVSYAALKPETVKQQTQLVTDRVTCRAVDEAIVAYVGVNGTEPQAIAQLTAFVDGDIHAYRIVAGRAAGPGC
jgi:hypothetical protein